MHDAPWTVSCHRINVFIGGKHMTKAKGDTVMSHSSASAIRTAYSGLDSHLLTINSRLYALLDQLVAIRLDLTHGAMSEAQSSASANRQLQLMVERIDAAIV